MKNEKSPSLLGQLWKQFSSMKFAIIVLLILAIVSLISLFLGEFYPVKASGPGWQEFWRQQMGWSKPVFNTFVFFQLHEPFRSWWYRILLFLLSLSLFSCIIERIPITIKAIKRGATRSGEDIAKMKTAANFTLKESPETVLTRLPGAFRYYREQQDKEWRVTGSRLSMAYWGPVLTHTGLLSLAIGGLIASWLGFSTMVGGYPGNVMTDPGYDFEVRVDDFSIEYYPLGLGQYVLIDNSFIGRIVGREGEDKFVLETRSHGDDLTRVIVEASRLRNQYNIEMDRGNISDYVTLATVFEDGEKISSHRIEVNKPLRYKGYRFYQTSFDYENPQVTATIDSAQVQLMRASDDTVLDTVFVHPDSPLTLPDNTHLVLAQFLPDFKMVESIPTSVSARLGNPALQLEVHNDGKKQYHQWTFLNNPFLHSTAQATYKFQALEIYGFEGSESYKTILAVRKTPGTTLIWIGFILATVGLLMAFYMVPQRLWIVIREVGKDRSEVVMGGTAAKNQDLFQHRFEGWIRRLKAEK
jgi:cytochrome c biogenesis protein